MVTNDAREGTRASRANRAALRVLQEIAGHIEWGLESADVVTTGIDILGRGTPGERFAVEVKRLSGPNRTELLKGVVAMATLQLQRHAPKNHKIVWLHVDRIGQKVARALREYLLEVSPETGLVLIDDQGGRHLHLPMLGIEHHKVPSPIARDTKPGRQGAMFSDLNMWLLKILLMRHFPVQLWSGPRVQPTTVSALASIASVSQSKAHRFAKIMSEAGFLRVGNEGLQLTRVAALLEAWRSHYQTRVVSLLAVRPLFEFAPASARPPPGLRFVLGGQFAAEAFGLNHVTKGRQLIWIDFELQRALESFELVPTERPGTLYIGRPPYRESVFRGRVEHGSLPVVDPCEMMLEAVFDPQRGLEQSDYIQTRLLDWYEGRG